MGRHLSRMTCASSEVQLVNKSHLKCRLDRRWLPQAHCLALCTTCRNGQHDSPPNSSKNHPPLCQTGFLIIQQAETALDGKLLPERNVSAGWDNSTHHQISLDLHRQSSGWETCLVSARQSIASLRLDLTLLHKPDCKAKLLGNNKPPSKSFQSVLKPIC